MISYIYPVAKCPTQTRARIGPKFIQDWYCAIVRSAVLLKELKLQGIDSRILIVTGFQMKGQRPESTIFVEELLLLGVSLSDIVTIEKGMHTGDQVHIAEEYAKEHKSKLITISTFVHFFHVKYYSRPSAKHLIVFGMPNMKEVLKDPAMPFIAWLIDRRFKWRLSFEEWVLERRTLGKL